MLTLGGLGVVHPELNIISAFTLAVLAGVGVDFGIHFLSHYSLNRKTATDTASALTRTLQRLLGPMTMAAVTTATGFLALYPASFRGFSQMGVVCAAGIVATFASTLLLAPAALSWLDRGPLGRELVRPLPALDDLLPPVRWRVLVVSLGLALGAALGWYGIDRLEFERDFRRLRPAAAAQHGIPWGRALHGTERNSVFLVADDPASLQQAAATIRAEGAPLLVKSDRPWLLTPASFVPEDQEARLAAIARLRAAAERVQRASDDPEFGRLRTWLAVDRPIVKDDLPEWVRGWFVERDGKFGRLGVLYTDLSGSSVDDMETLSRALDGYRTRFPEVRFASGVALLGEVVPGLERDAPVIVLLATLGLALAVLAVRRSFRWLGLVLVPLLLSAAISVGLLALFDVRINFYNLLVFPLAVGMGIDGSIYVTEALIEPRTNRDFATAARAVLGATLTTVAGFSALLVANNPGLVSLAKVAIVTMGSTLVVNLVWLPRWIAGRVKSRARA
jgi:predicted RND superfamily exporter protein